MLIDVVAQEAKARGLACERADVRKGLRNKCVRIAGYACQIVPLHLYLTGKDSDLVDHALYLPRSDWPDFIIYVFANGKETSRFFIVPRGEMSKETSVCAPNNWLFKYENAWPLLSATIAPEKLDRRFDNTPWKLRVVIRKAEALGLEVRLIAKKNLPSRHLKDRLLINSCKCQVITAGVFLRRDLDIPFINLYAPKTSWADFLIFVMPDNVEHVFIVPRSKITKTTSTILESKWLAKYADNWDAVIARDPAYESRNAVIDEPAVQTEVAQARLRLKEQRQAEAQANLRLKEQRQAEKFRLEEKRQAERLRLKKKRQAEKLRLKEQRQAERLRLKEKRQKPSRKRAEMMTLPPMRAEMMNLPPILPKYTLEEEMDYLVQRANAMFKRP